MRILYRPNLSRMSLLSRLNQARLNVRNWLAINLAGSDKIAINVEITGCFWIDPDGATFFFNTTGHGIGCFPALLVRLSQNEKERTIAAWTEQLRGVRLDISEGRAAWPETLQ